MANPCYPNSMVSTKQYLYIPPALFLLFDDNEIEMARKPAEKQKENPVGCTVEGKRWKGNSREDETGTVLELSL